LAEIQEIVVRRNFPATMRDGTVLYSDVYRPGGEFADGRFPVLLTRTPYGKEDPNLDGFVNTKKLVRSGYIVAIQDVRGRNASGGAWSPFANEYDDGHDTVEWAASLPGSDGRVGMYGPSYLGAVQWQAALSRPPSLGGIAPAITFGNPLNGFVRRGGARELGIWYWWCLGVLAPDAVYREYRGKSSDFHPVQIGELVREVDDVLRGYGTLPLKDLPDADGAVPFLRGWLGRGLKDPSWDGLNLDGRQRDIEARTLHVAGWYDIYLGETLRQHEAMTKGDPEDSSSPYLLVGPWSHAGVDSSTVGELDFGVASSGLSLNLEGDLTDYHLRFFDAALKGDGCALSAQARVQVFVMGENRWRGYDGWPVPGSREETWYLREDAGLSRESPRWWSAPDVYDYDPLDPVPTIGGATQMAPPHRPGAYDQRPIEARPDVLVYTSEALVRNYTVLGHVHATLFAASSAPDTDFVVRLVDVHPDGRAIGVTDGIVRASARESYPAPGVLEPRETSPIEPGRVYEYAVDLWATGLTFLAGHRIRVEVTSSSFPRWDRNLNTGEDGFHSARTEVARQRIFHDPGRPSRVTLTVVDAP
jgi:putative CocE/NonD family hydrolase